jgi:hypothetical protein
VNQDQVKCAAGRSLILEARSKAPVRNNWTDPCPLPVAHTVVVADSPGAAIVLYLCHVHLEELDDLGITKRVI